MSVPAEKILQLGEERTVLYPVLGSPFGVWVIERVRTCLSCGVSFWSWGPDNRICSSCKDDESYQAVTSLVDANLIPLYDHDLDPDWEPENPEALKQEAREKSFWEASKEKGAKKLKCPVCGETVWRPGTADQHPCFIHSQNALTQKEMDIRQSLQDIRISPPGYFSGDGHHLSRDDTERPGSLMTRNYRREGREPLPTELFDGPDYGPGDDGDFDEEF